MIRFNIPAMSRWGVILLALALMGCASKYQPIGELHRKDYLPSGASQMGSYATGGQPLTRVSGGSGSHGPPVLYETNP